MVEVPFPVVLTLPGVRVTVQISDAGRPESDKPPVDEVQLGCMIFPGIGEEGTLFTVNENSTMASEHG